MRNARLALAWLALGISLAIPAASQNYIYNIGSPTFTTEIPINDGFINVNNGEVHLEIPLATQTVRGRMPLRETLEYDSRIWQIVPSDGDYWWEPTNVPNSMGGWRLSQNTDAANNPVYYYDSVIQWVDCNDRGYDEEDEWYGFSWTDPEGTVHEFDGNFYTFPSTPCGQTGEPASTTIYAADGSGYSMYVSYVPGDNVPTETVYDSQGNEMYPTVQDPNGNYYSTNVNGMVDTLGRNPVTSTGCNGNYNQTCYNVLTYGGGTATYTVTTETVYYSSDFQQEDVGENSGSFTAIQSIALPDGSSYSFTYDSGTTSGHYGELLSMTLPSGGVINFNYTNFQDSFQNENRWLNQVTKDGGTTTYSPATVSDCSGSNTCEEQVASISPDGNVTVYTFTLDPSTYVNATSWNTGIDIYQGDQNGAPKLKSVDTSYTYNTQEYQNPDGTTSTYEIPQTQTVLTSLFFDPTIETAETLTTLDANGVNPTDVKQWDYYVGSAPSNPTMETTYQYGYTVNGANLPTEIKVMDGSGNTVEDTQIGYDQTTPTPTSGLPNHNTPTGPYGDVTSVSKWINTSNSYQTTTAKYDDAGTTLSMTDPDGTTTFGHDSTDTFVTSTTLPTPSSGVSLSSSANYDFSSSLLSSTTDPNSQTTSYKNYDAFGRVGEIDYPDGGKTTFTYTPAGANPPQTSIYQYQNSNSRTDTEILYDGYARQSRVAVYNGQSSNSWYQNDVCYDEDGRVEFQSYRYQGPGFGAAKVCSGAGDTSTYDALGRTTNITHGDGTQVASSYTGRATETTDENGVSRITQTDALGRITAACEVTSTTLQSSGAPSSCGLDIGGTGYLTTYAYNLANHTTTVSQGVQTRVFQTDSIGRPILVQEPESGQTTYSYTYNSTGLQVTRIRPTANQANAAVTTTTTYQYDALDRPLSVMYSDGTPTKYFYYDQSTIWGNSDVSTGAGLGRLTAASSTVNEQAFVYDPMGRVTENLQCLPTECGNGALDKWLYYSYDWLGNMLTATDGNGVTDAYTYSPANEVLSITSSLNDSTDPPNLVSNVQNGPFGPLSWQLGNGLTGVRTYDSLGRISGGWLCVGSSQSYCTGGTTQVYGFTSSWKGSQFLGGCDTVLNVCVSYGYDEFNRLTSRNVGQGQGANFTYVYDRWGNRWEQNVTSGSGPEPDLSFSTLNNQITNTGYAYDAAGNMTSDGIHNYQYDADGNLSLVDGGSTADYLYNAFNQRVESEAGGDGSEYAFNLDGQRASAWDANSGNNIGGLSYWGSVPLELYAGGSATFRHYDYLGTERIRTTYNGGVEGTMTSLPFGDGVNGSGGSIPFQFAGMNQDSSSNDHARFREYSDMNGQWMSPDPYSGSYDLSNPQSFNRYAYVLNNPLSMTDPAGLFVLAPPPPAAGCPICLGVIGGIDLVAGLGKLFGWWGGPSFHGTLKPRPNAQPWDEYNIHYGPNIAGALGLPDAGCEFGACGGGAMGLTSGITSAASSIDLAGMTVAWGCLAANILEINSVSKLNVSGSNLVGSPYTFNGGMNFDFSVPGASESELAAGRYPSSTFNFLTGIGPSLHVTSPGGADPSTYGIGPNGAFNFTTHIDSAYSTWHTPAGALMHWHVDVRDKGAHRGPC